jgi:hypothetical protein
MFPAQQKRMRVIAKAAAYTANAADGLAVLSGNDFTVTLPAAASCKGAVLRFENNGSLAHALKTYTIGAITAIHTLGEVVTIVSDGTTWRVLDRRIPSYWIDNPIGGDVLFNSAGVLNSTQRTRWKREGDSIRVSISFVFGANAASAGACTLNMPIAGLTIDDAKLSSTVAQGISTAFNVGRATFYDLTTTVWKGMFISVETTTRLGVGIELVNATYPAMGGVSNTVPFTGAAGDFLFFDYLIPIVGWNG